MNPGVHLALSGRPGRAAGLARCGGRTRGCRVGRDACLAEHAEQRRHDLLADPMPGPPARSAGRPADVARQVQAEDAVGVHEGLELGAGRHGRVGRQVGQQRER
jgi:hypothetical protein